jgi:hypothetical protein
MLMMSELAANHQNPARLGIGEVQERPRCLRSFGQGTWNPAPREPFEVARLRPSQPAASARDRTFAFYAVLGEIPR